MPQFLATTCQKKGSFDEVDLYARPFLQLFVIALWEISQSPDRKITKNGSLRNFTFEVIIKS